VRIAPSFRENYRRKNRDGKRKDNMQSYIRYDLVPQMINVASVLNEYFIRLLDDNNGLH